MTSISLGERRRLLIRSLCIAIAVSGVLALSQLAGSVLTGSVGIRAAALDRLIDISVHAAALVGVWAATRPPDRRHPYGYERYETLTSMAIGVFLLVTVLLVVRSSIARLDDPAAVEFALVGVAVMVPASLASFWLAWFMNRQSRTLKSDVVMTESSHFWADGLTNAAVVAGILASEAGMVRIDPLIGLLVSGLIGLRALRIVAGAVDRLTDAAYVAIEEVVELALQVPGVLDCHAVRSRGVPGGARIDLHIHVDPELRVLEAHGLAVKVEAAIKERFPEVVEALVHIGAYGGDLPKAELPTGPLTRFDDMAQSYEAWFQTPLGRYVDRHEKETIVRLLAPTGGDSILEVGSGTGYYLEHLATSGALCVGVEPSARMLEVAMSRPRRIARYVRAVGELLPFENDSFDGLLYMTTLEFIQNPDAAIREAARVVRPGGRLVFGVLNAAGPWAAARRREGGLWREAHFYHASELESLLTPLGSVHLAYCVHISPALAARLPRPCLDIADLILGRLFPGNGALIGAVVRLRGTQ